MIAGYPALRDCGPLRLSSWWHDAEPLLCLFFGCQPSVMVVNRLDAIAGLERSPRNVTSQCDGVGNPAVPRSIIQPADTSCLCGLADSTTEMMNAIVPFQDDQRRNVPVDAAGHWRGVTNGLLSHS